MSEIEESDTNEEGNESPEVNQTNLFEVRDKELKAGGKRTWLHRLYLVASLDLRYEEPEDIQRRASLVKTQLDEFGGECEQQIKQLYNTYREEAASGFLLIYPRYMVHMLESSEDCIVAYLMALRQMRQEPNSKLLDTKVLLMAHDIPTRLFEAWSYRGIGAPSREQVDSSMSSRKAATACLTQLLGLAAHLKKTPKANLKNAMDLLSERVPELLPTEDLLQLLLKQDAFLSVEEYLDLYYTPLAPADETELVWPLPGHMFPYYH
ncbi:testis-expressed protein 47-like [Amphibalanus amphitrite]|nr:testis-expressed protein 47-like [Amphibalanus amphitrite]